MKIQTTSPAALSAMNRLAAHPLPTVDALYERLLRLRISLGLAFLDDLVHDPRTTSVEKYQEILLLEDALEGFVSFQQDLSEQVHPAEEARFHNPGVSLPTNNHEFPCRQCRKAAALLPATVILPAIQVAA